MIAEEQRRNEMLLRRYLLGQAAAEEQRMIERNLLADQEYFDQLLRCEEELIDEYACGAMKAADREYFEKHFMATAERRESVAFAQGLRRYFTSQKRSRSGTWELSPAAAMRMNLAFMVAVIVLAAASALLLRTTLQLRRLVDQNRSELSQAEQREKALTGRIAQLTDRVQELSRVEPSTQDGSDLASLTLAPGLSRAEDSSAMLKLSKKIHSIRLILKIEGESYPNYRVEIQDTEGNVVWSNNGLKARRTGKQKIVEFTLPAGLITRNDYLVMLSGASASGTFDKISSYHFSVIRK
jgi:hypothetical protein